MKVCSVLGGKDSTALYLWMLDQGWNFKPIFADTGHEHPVTLNYVRNMHDFCKGPKVEIVKADFSAKIGERATGSGMMDLLLWKKRAPSARAQFCTEHLKMAPIRIWLERMLPVGDAAEMYVGIRAAESVKRSTMPEHEFSDYYDCDLYRPLLRWSEEQVWAQLKKHNVAPNPLYTEGSATRVGCYPCIHARKSELAAMPDWAWDRLRGYEATRRLLGEAGSLLGLSLGSSSLQSTMLGNGAEPLEEACR